MKKHFVFFRDFILLPLAVTLIACVLIYRHYERGQAEKARVVKECVAAEYAVFLNGNKVDNVNALTFERYDIRIDGELHEVYLETK